MLTNNGNSSHLAFDVSGNDSSVSLNIMFLLLLLSRFSRVRLMRPQRRQPTRLPCPWDSPGKNTGVGCHFLLQCRKVKSESEVVQSCPTLHDPMDCSLPGSPRPWDFPGKSTGVGCHCLLQNIMLGIVLWCMFLSILSLLSKSFRKRCLIFIKFFLYHHLRRKNMFFPFNYFCNVIYNKFPSVKWMLPISISLWEWFKIC